MTPLPALLPWRRHTRIWLGCAALLLGSFAHAASDTPRRFDIPSDTADKALQRFSDQAGVAVVFGTDTTVRVRTNAVTGDMPPSVAIARLLEGTGLVIVPNEKNGTITVVRGPNAPGAAPTRAGVRPNARPADDEAAIVLSPFEVVSTQDYGYTATNTLAGGRLNTALRETPAAISVLTREFLDDIGGGDFRSALQYATNAIPVGDTDTSIEAGIGTTRAGGAQAETSPTGVRVRGFAESRATRNYFVWNLNSDNYNTERIDVARGPNTLIFGDAGSGGVANITTKQARFDPFQRLVLRSSSYGGGRASVDVNRPVNDALAIRLNALVAREHGWRDIESYARDGVHGSATWKISRSSQLRADFEWGHLETHVPQTVTRDNISAWNGTFVINAPLPGTAGPAGSTGAARFDSAARPDYMVMITGAESLGFVNWRGFGRTNGNDSSLETRLSPVAPADAVPLRLDRDAMVTLGRHHYGVLPYREFSVTPGNRKFETDFGAATVVFNQQFGPNVFFEAGYAHQEDYRSQNVTGQTNFVFLDINAVQPNGSPNPNFLRPFMDFINNRDDRDKNRYDEFRASGVYQLRTRLTDQKLGFFASRRQNKGISRLIVPRWVNNPREPNLNSTSNQPVFRTYLRDRNAPVPNTTLTGDFNGVRIALVETNGGSRTTTVNETAQVFASGAWFDGRRLKTLVGVRRDVSDSESWSPTTDPVSGLLTGYVPDSQRSVAQTSPTAGAVYEIFKGFSVYANYSESFLAASGGALKLDGSISEPRRGEGREVGFKFELFNERISGSALYYDQTEQNNVIRVLAGNNSDLVGAGLTSVGVHLNTIGATLNRPIFSNGRTTLTDYRDTQDVHATGFEIDLTANLTRGWSLLANFAVPEIEAQNALADTRAFVAANRASWVSAATAIGPAALATVNERLAIIDGQIAQFPDGRKSNGVVTYTGNFFTRYRFMEGPFKGLSFGGGVNLRGKRIAGVQTDGSVIYSSGYPVVNALAGYATKFRRVAVNLQLNVSNLFDGEYQRYSGYYTTGGVVQPYIYTQQAPRRLLLTATFGF